MFCTEGARMDGYTHEHSSFEDAVIVEVSYPHIWSDCYSAYTLHDRHTCIL